MLTWNWPPRTAIFRHRSQTAKGQPNWVDEPGTDAAGLDQSRMTARWSKHCPSSRLSVSRSMTEKSPLIPDYTGRG